MQISAKADYAVRALLLLAAQAPDLVKVDELTHRQELPRTFVTAILSELRRAGLVRSRRGADGGYGLALPADRITVGAVLSVVEGPLEFRSSRGDAYGVAEHLPRMWTAVRASMQGVLETTTLEDLLTGHLPEHVEDLARGPRAPLPRRPAPGA